MKKGPNGFDSNGLKLEQALRILEHAGKPNPLQRHSDPKVQIQFLIDALCELSLNDGLTGLVNATFFQAALARELDRSARTGRNCALLLIDLDYFKRVNDGYGHHIGDQVLQAVALKMKNSLRSMDTAGRVGGDEFGVILPECTPEDSVRAATRIHAVLNPLPILLGDKTIQITASAGLFWIDSHSISEADTLIAKADKELYRAKHSGRRRLCHPPLTSTLVSTEERAALALPKSKEDNYGH
jgi:diguanylate cyclase (GGDEF)-like protein